ncbi:hypothetical protein Acr_23g0007720 [Actinidia rufa]|uniref:Uncharacterized protein n=1 Tax=Actinidia rufa TaxID=165716 RepID=A0A7J0GNK1_9ERIC|nr:hypothetical protein Acr_23g0007720 [Actinidia rufa]
MASISLATPPNLSPISLLPFRPPPSLALPSHFHGSPQLPHPPQIKPIPLLNKHTQPPGAPPTQPPDYCHQSTSSPSPLISHVTGLGCEMGAWAVQTGNCSSMDEPVCAMAALVRRVRRWLRGCDVLGDGGERGFGCEMRDGVGLVEGGGWLLLWQRQG